MRIYRLVKLVIDRKISEDVIGTYFLWKYVKGSYELRYVGRSDGRLKKRLVAHMQAKAFSHFSFKATGSILEAYYTECKTWHDYRGRLCNKIHPDSPRNLPYFCPYCEVSKNFEAIGGGI